MLLKTFLLPIIFSLIVLAAVFVWGGVAALMLAVLLTILEVTLSFDNAVVNARILAQMDEKWQQRFLTWGIIIAVFLTRFVLPILIVSASVSLSPLAVFDIAIKNPEQYGHLLEGAHYAIASFGGIFLLMVSLKYFFNEAKDIHWIQFIEGHVSRWGRIEAVEIGVALVLLAAIAHLVPQASSAILFSGVIGIALFIIIQGIANSFTLEAGKVAATGSIALFVYLNILDAAFSLDGVIGAFAITNQLLVIVAGLGIGAFFVRTLTVFLVRQKTLDTLVYLEHGAHWAILGLAIAMLASLFIHVPEVITGSVGLAFVAFSYWSSLRARSKLAPSPL